MIVVLDVDATNIYTVCCKCRLHGFGEALDGTAESIDLRLIEIFDACDAWAGGAKANVAAVEPGNVAGADICFEKMLGV